MKRFRNLYKARRVATAASLTCLAVGALALAPAGARADGNALAFDGSDDYVTWGNDLGLSQLTISLWFKKEAGGSTASTGSGGVSLIPLVGKGRGENDGSTVDCNYLFGIESSTGALAADFEEGAGGSAPGLNHPVIGSTPIQEGAWNHAALTYDGQSWTIYLNGQLEGRLFVGEPLRADSIQHFALGAALNSTGVRAGAFAGAMDEVSVWSRALSPAEIVSLMFDSPDAASVDLEGYWKLDASTGLAVADELGARDGTLANASAEAWIESGFDRSTVALPPVGLTAQPATTDSVRLRWQNLFSDSQELALERRVSGGAWEALATLPAGASEHVDATIARGVTYEYRARAAASPATSNIAVYQAATPEGNYVARFRYGLNGYYATQDLALRKLNGAGPDGNWNAANIYADTNSAADIDLPLIQFLDLVGPNAGQTPAGVKVERATLRLWVGAGNNRSNNALALHRMLVDWDQSSTWNSLGDGVSRDDAEAAAAPDATYPKFPYNNTWSEWDVTATLQRIVDGAAENHGWALFNAGGDGFGIATLESIDASLRPELVIEYSYGDLPPAPESLAVTQASPAGVELVWDDLASGEQSYAIHRAQSVYGPWTEIASLPADSESYFDASVAANERYFYRVAVANAAGVAQSAFVGALTGDYPIGLEFEGAGDYVTMGPALGQSELTISLWFKKTGAGSGAGTGSGGINAVPLVTKGRGENDQRTLNCNYFFGIDTVTGALGADFEESHGGSSPGLNHPIVGSTVIEEGAWYHGALTYDGATWRLYVNGQLDAELFVGEPLAFDSIQHFGLGVAMNSTGAPSGSFEGLMTDVSLWSRALDLAAIRDLMSGAPDLSAAGLAGYWPLSQTHGDSVHDELGFHDGAMVSLNDESWVGIELDRAAFVFAPSGLEARNLAYGQVALSWSDDSSNESGFVVERAESPFGPWTQIADLPANETAFVDTTAPYSAESYYRVAPKGALSTSNLAVAQPGTQAGLLTTSFRYGFNNYTATQDLGIRQSVGSGPDAPWNVAEIYTDNNSASNQDQILIKFADLFGDRGGQVPEEALIAKATLRLWVGGGNNRTNATVNLHRLLRDWSDQDSWNSLVGGIAADGAEALAEPDDSKAGIPVSNQWSEWDVTEALQAYQSGDSQNFGWTLLNEGSDGFGIWTSEAPNAVERPQLLVEYSFGALPEAPAGIVAGPASESSVLVEWLDSADEQRYAIERALSPEGPWTTLEANAPAGQTSYADSGLEADTKYFYRVIAFNGNGGRVSEVAAARTDDRPYGLRTLSFRQGVNGYQGATDIGLAQTAPETPGLGQILWVDNNSATDESQVVLRFDDLFGDGLDRIPADTAVEKAFLRIYVSSASNAQSNSPMHFHQMQVDWDGSDSWNSPQWAGNGVDEEDGEARAQPDSVVLFSQQDAYYEVDVTPTLRRWLEGEPAYGWLIQTYGSNGYAYSSSRMESIEQRPELVVVFDTDPANLYPEMTDIASPQPGATGVAEPAWIDFGVADANGDSIDVALYGRKIADADAQNDFSVVLLPDTQFYSAEMNGATAEIFDSQTEWIIENREALNIKFVLHMGDITQHGDVMPNGTSAEWQWVNASNAMYKLEDPALTGLPEGIPYGVAVGNHDQSPIWDPNGTTTYYNKYFGADHFAGKSYYGAHYGSNNDNYYQLYTVGEFKFLSISLEYRPSADPALLQWVDELIKAHPDRRAIITTHHMVNTGNPASWSPYGQAIYEALKGNPNLDLLLGGHIHGEGRRQDTYNGHTVHSLLQDYQGYVNGGNGYLRILTFSPRRNKIYAKTYSPWTNAFERDADSEFELDYDMGADLTEPELLGQWLDLESGERVRFEWDGLDANSQYEWFAQLEDGRKVRVSERAVFTTAGSTYSSWRDAAFQDGDAATGREDDLDLDGYTNFFEFVFNSNPRAGADVNMPTVALGAGDTTVRYQRVKDAGLAWSYEISTNLIDWQAPAPEQLVIEESVEDNGDGSETVTLQIRSSLKSVFWRIAVD